MRTKAVVLLGLSLTLASCSAGTPAANTGGPSAPASSAVASPPSPSPSPSPAASGPLPFPRKTSTPGATPGFPMPEPGSVDQHRADKVAVAAAIALSASDTTLDADPNQTARRAIAWLAPSMAAQVRKFPPIAAPGALWATWAAHRAYLLPTAVLVDDSGRPADSAAIAYRQLAVSTTAIGRDGWKASPTRSIVFMTLNNVAGNWRVAQVHTAA
jgi:hypothetical protein